MNKQKLIKSVLVGMAIATFSSSAFATLSWDTCGIVRVGAIGDASKAVKLTSCSNGNNNKWLNISKQQNASLAVLLTALSLGKKVKMQAHYNLANTSSVGAGADIEVIYLDQ